jgi:hypothetical protein
MKKGEYPIYINFNDEFTSVLSNKDRVYNFYADDNEENNKIELNGSI